MSDITEPETRGGRPPRPLTLADLTAEPALAMTELRQLSGRVRGSSLGAWAENLNRRHGPDAADAVRATLGLDRIALPDKPTADDWLPGWVQVALTDCIAARHYEGDLEALEVPALADGQRAVRVVTRLVLRGLGPRRMLLKTPQLHTYLWDLGACSVKVDDHSAVLTVSGSSLFTYRTYLALQLMAIRAAVELGGRRVQTRHATRLGDNRAQIAVRWG